MGTPFSHPRNALGVALAHETTMNGRLILLALFALLPSS